MDILKQRKCKYCRRYRCRCDHDSRLNNAIKATKVSEETFNRDKEDAETDLENIGPLAAAAGGLAAGAMATKAGPVIAAKVAGKALDDEKSQDE